MIQLRGAPAALMLLIACAPALPPGAASAFAPPVDDLVAANEALGDPWAGRFPFDRAVEGLPPDGELVAVLHTDEGDIECVLQPDHAPITVANFVGLARGKRPFRGDDGQWRTEPYYRDLIWHRAIEGQFVQTGRRGKQATGGFLLQDEISPGDSFDRPGVLAMGNTGTEHSGSTQFFITTGAVADLEGAHTIFGQCDGEAPLRRLERRAAAGQGPKLLEITIRRRSRNP